MIVLVGFGSVSRWFRRRFGAFRSVSEAFRSFSDAFRSFSDAFRSVSDAVRKCLVSFLKRIGGISNSNFHRPASRPGWPP